MNCFGFVQGYVTRWALVLGLVDLAHTAFLAHGKEKMKGPGGRKGGLSVKDNNEHHTASLSFHGAPRCSIQVSTASLTIKCGDRTRSLSHSVRSLQRGVYDLSLESEL